MRVLVLLSMFVSQALAMPRPMTPSLTPLAVTSSVQVIRHRPAALWTLALELLVAGIPSWSSSIVRMSTNVCICMCMRTGIGLGEGRGSGGSSESGIAAAGRSAVVFVVVDVVSGSVGLPVCVGMVRARRGRGERAR